MSGHRGHHCPLNSTHIFMLLWWEIFMLYYHYQSQFIVNSNCLSFLWNYSVHGQQTCSELQGQTSQCFWLLGAPSSSGQMALSYLQVLRTPENKLRQVSFKRNKGPEELVLNLFVIRSSRSLVPCYRKIHYRKIVKGLRTGLAMWLTPVWSRKEVVCCICFCLFLGLKSFLNNIILFQ